MKHCIIKVEASGFTGFESCKNPELEAFIKGGGGWGVQAFHFGKTDFELGVGGGGQDISRQFEVSFGSIRAILPV